MAFRDYRMKVLLAYIEYLLITVVINSSGISICAFRQRRVVPGVDLLTYHEAMRVLGLLASRWSWKHSHHWNMYGYDAILEYDTTRRRSPAVRRNFAIQGAPVSAARRRRVLLRPSAR